MTTLHAQLVGVSFRPAEAKAIVIALKVGDILELEREPDNEHDPNAVKVMTDNIGSTDVFLGYIERGVAAVLAPMMDEGRSFSVTVNTRLSPKSVLLAIEENKSE